MKIVRVENVDGARSARGAVVVIDVIRAFTTAATALAWGAVEILLVDSPDAAFQLKKRFPDSFVMGEVGGIKVDGFDHGNSPSDFPKGSVQGRRIIQCTGSGTRCAVAASGADVLYVAGLTVAGSTARALASAEQVTLVASSGSAEGDDAVGDYLEGLLTGNPRAAPDILRRVRESEAGRRVASGAYPQYPKADLDHCARIDAHDFAMRARLEDGLLVTRAIRP